MARSLSPPLQTTASPGFWFGSQGKSPHLSACQLRVYSCGPNMSNPFAFGPTRTHCPGPQASGRASPKRVLANIFDESQKWVWLKIKELGLRRFQSFPFANGAILVHVIDPQKWRFPMQSIEGLVGTSSQLPGKAGDDLKQQGCLSPMSTLFPTTEVDKGLPQTGAEAKSFSSCLVLTTPGCR